MLEIEHPDGRRYAVTPEVYRRRYAARGFVVLSHEPADLPVVDVVTVEPDEVDDLDEPDDVLGDALGDVLGDALGDGA